MPSRRMLVVVSAVVVAAASLVTVRATAAEVYVVPTSALEPEIPRGSRVLISKLGDHIRLGRIVAYHTGAQVHLGRVDAIDVDSRRIEVSRNGVLGVPVDVEDVIGHVVLNTR